MCKRPRTSKKGTILNIIYTVILIILIGVMVFSAYKIYKILHGYSEGKSSYQDIAADVITVTAASDEPQTESEEPVEEEPPITVDFEKLKEKIPDAVGWIYSPGTKINYPIVQGSDNSYYLNHLPTGEYNSCGSIFADCNNNVFEDTNTILYGHHMRDGSMFRSLVEYKDQEYYEEHKIIYIATPEKIFELRIICGAIIDGWDDIYFNIGGEYDMTDILSRIMAESTFYSDETYTLGDKLVTLSTCTYEYNDARYVIIGKLCELA